MSPCPETSRRRPRGRQLLGMLAALLLAVAYVAGGPSTQARAADPEDQVRVELTSMSPRIATSDDTVTLSGTVTNTSGLTLVSLQAYFWRDQQLRTTRAQLADPAGQVGARYLPTFVTLGAEGTLAPGGEAEFTVTMPAAELGVALRDGVTRVGVQIRGNDGTTGNTTLGRALAWLPRDVGDPQESVAVASVVALASTPSRLREGWFTDDRLAGELAEGGRLDVLLDEAGRTGRTWLVDPALLVALADMADEDGYELADGTPGEGSGAARDWLGRYDSLTTEGHRLPYASADVELIGAIGRPAVLLDALDEPAVPGDASALPIAAWPFGGILSADGLAALDAVGEPVTVLASNVPGTTTVGERTVVAYDPAALALEPASQDSLIQLRQIGAATAFLDALEGRDSQVRILDDTASARVDAADTVGRTPLSQLPGTVGTEPELQEPVDGTEPDARGDDVATAAAERDSLVGLFTEAGDDADATSRIVASLASSRWPGDPPGYEAFRSWEREQADAILRGDALTISAQPVLLTAREDTAFPVTVTNNLASPVSVRVEFSSENNDRLHVPVVDVPGIGAGEAIGVTAVPEVESNGRFTVVAQLATPSGRPIGAPVDIEVQATQAGRVGWILVIVSGIVLVGSTVLRIKRVRAERSKA